MVDNINTIANLTSVIAPPVQPPSLVAALQSFLTGSGVPNVPQALLQSPSGNQITAVVLAANPQGQILLQTPLGQIVFNSGLPLTVGQQLSLETLPRQPLLQQVPGAPPPPPSAAPLDVRLVRVNGVPAENVFPQATSSPTNTPETAPKGQQQIQPATNGLFLRAVFPQVQQKPDQQNTSTSSLFDAEAVEYDPSPLQNRASFQATVLSTPTPFSPSNNSNSVQNTGLDAVAEALGGITENSEQPLTQLKAGDVLTLKITGGTLAAPQPQPTNSAAPVTYSPTIAATFTETPIATPVVSTAETSPALPSLTTFGQSEAPITPPSTTPPQTAAPLLPPTVSQQLSAVTTTLLLQNIPDNVETEPYNNIQPQTPVYAYSAPSPNIPFSGTPVPFFNPSDPPPTLSPTIYAPVPTPSSASPTTAIVATRLPGVVIAQEADGSSIVQTSVATLRLPPDVSLPRGTQLSLQVDNIKPALDLFAASQLPSSFQTGNPATDALIKGSTALDTLFKQLAGLSSDTAKTTAKELIPQPGKQFGNKILEFISNVKQESLPENICQAVPKEMLEQLGLNHTTSEFSGLKTAMAEAPPPQWSFMLIPVMQGEDMRHMRWFKRKQTAEAGSNSGDGTRFVIELETKSLGQIQLDGLFFNQPRTKEFDLVVRSQKEFSAEEQQQIAGIYNNYGEITGYRGSLRFEQTAAFPIQPLKDIISGQSREISA